MQPQNSQLASVRWLFTFLMMRQRSLRLQRSNRLSVMKKAFRARQRRRRMLLVLLNRLIDERQNQPTRQTPRRAWAWPRNQKWFDLLLADRSLDSQWPEHFRISRQTFEYLCDLLRPDLQRQDTRMRKATTVEKQVLVGLWRFATGNSFRNCGQQFGLGKSTAKEACNSFEEALLSRKDAFIKFPSTGREVKEKINAFEQLYGIPQIVGSIDGCHIEINTPSVADQGDYFDSKQRYSVTLQAIVDCDLKFIHATVGYPGSLDDASVLKLSGFYELAEKQQILAGPSRELRGKEVRPLVVGDSAYPLTKWLIKPYSDRGVLTREKRKFNTKLRASRSVVDRALRMLKARFGIVTKKTEQRPASFNKTLTAACVLHNICIDRGDVYDVSDIDIADSDDNSGDEEGNEELATGDDTRDSLKDYVWHNL